MAKSRLIEDKYLKSCGKTVSYLEDISHNTGIYKWTNKTNGKVYIGQAITLNKRRTDFLNFKWRYAGDLINKARLKYNDSKYWEYEIISFCTKDILDIIETNNISKYDSTNRDLGYNLADGGRTNRGFKMSEEAKEKVRIANIGKKVSEETKMKMRIARLGKAISEEAKEKISIANRGENNWLYGKHLSEEHKQKIRNSNLGRKHTEETKRKISEKKYKPIYQLTKENIIIKLWNSTIEASKELGINNISKCCNGNRETAGGYKWRFK